MLLFIKNITEKETICVCPPLVKQSMRKGRKLMSHHYSSHVRKIDYLNKNFIYEKEAVGSNVKVEVFVRIRKENKD